MGTHLRALSKIYPMDTNMTAFGWFFKNLCVIIIVPWEKVASALEGLNQGITNEPKFESYFWCL